MINKDIQVFTDADLDGAISYLTLCWYFGSELPVKVTTEKDLLSELNTFLKDNKIESYRRVYLLDIDICSVADIADRPNFSIVDHHLGSINCAHKFKIAKTKIRDEGSTCKLLYNVLKTHYNRDLNEAQKLLVAIGHDYDSYKLDYKDLSIGLNMLFWNFQGNRIQKFYKRFSEGFNGFTNEEKRIIAYYKNKINLYLRDTPIYTANLKIGNEMVKASTIIADFCINEIAQEILEKTNSEIAIVVNTRTESVSFRRSKSSKVDLSKLSEKIADGGGHSSAAGGKITPMFLEFIKLFKYD